LSKASVATRLGGRLQSDVGDELLHGGEIARQPGRIVDEMEERDERVRLTAAVGQLKLLYRLIAPSSQPEQDRLDQLPQVESWVRASKELPPVAVDALRRPVGVALARAFTHGHGIEIGGKGRQREVAGLDVVAQGDDVMPGGPR